MGRVFGARDLKLGRDVAIKVLGASSFDEQQVRRFELEARAAGALNHPNIVAVYDIGSSEGKPYIVSELLQGATLRHRLGKKALPVQKAVDYALQLARGLAAAHDKGVIHRDLKPENLFVSSEMRLKILDFGIAKLVVSEAPGATLPADEARAATPPHKTETGMLMGTMGYMSPEQVRGEPADHRTDVFSAGAILYEMLAGFRPFERETPVETGTATLNEEPPELPARVPAELDRIVRRCLEKDPEDRYQSAKDLALDLEAAAAHPLARRRRGRWAGALGVVALVALASAAAFIAGRRGGEGPPRFQQLTFERGQVGQARFAPDGTVVYSAGWVGSPGTLFAIRPGSILSNPLGNGRILSVSRSGELLLLVSFRGTAEYWGMGTLARLPLAGGTPRELIEGVGWAEWAPDGSSFAIVRTVEGKNRLEFPPDHVLYQTAGEVTHPRFSARGDAIAFLDHPLRGDDRGDVAVVDLAGRKRTLSTGWDPLWGLAWAPGDGELWFSGGRASSLQRQSLNAVTLSGRERLVAHLPGSMNLLDVGADGRALILQGTDRFGIVALAPGATAERDFSWFGGPGNPFLSRDGLTLLFAGQSAGQGYGVYLRKMDGSPPVFLGEGEPGGLSPDGQWALVWSGDRGNLTLLPTGAGTPRPIPLEGVAVAGYPTLFPDGQRILFPGHEAGSGTRLYVVPVQGGKPRPISPEVRQWRQRAISHDGQLVAMRTLEGMTILPSAGGPSRDLAGVAGMSPAGFSLDDRALYVYGLYARPLILHRVDLATGKVEPWKEVRLSDPAGMSRVMLRLSSDERGYAYDYRRVLTDLYLVEGLSGK
jgi:hypothetical protein